MQKTDEDGNVWSVAFAPLAAKRLKSSKSSKKLTISELDLFFFSYTIVYTQLAHFILIMPLVAIVLLTYYQLIVF